jgi:hypothetical protein
MAMGQHRARHDGAEKQTETESDKRAGASCGLGSNASSQMGLHYAWVRSMVTKKTVYERFAAGPNPV